MNKVKTLVPCMQEAQAQLKPLRGSAAILIAYACPERNSEPGPYRNMQVRSIDSIIEANDVGALLDAGYVMMRQIVVPELSRMELTPLSTESRAFRNRIHFTLTKMT